MIKKIKYMITQNTVPYENLALEEYLLNNVREVECILYLWQNKKTVVIGRNQNSYKECRISELEAAGGYLVRRLSGGGAVFHDLGNLNFTFIANEKNYSVDRQTDVILQAVRKFGIDAQKTGRNDITVNGQKFSGNAYHSANGNCCHHGTILIKVDINNLSRFLNVSAGKIQSKGVKSVRARVINLTELNSEITVAGMKDQLIQSFSEVYGISPVEIPKSDINSGTLKKLSAKFSSFDWIFGKNIPFTCKAEKRFPWGEIYIELNVVNGAVTDAAVYSDALNTDFISALPEILKGNVFSASGINSTFAKLQLSEESRYIAHDILNLLFDIH